MITTKMMIIRIRMMVMMRMVMIKMITFGSVGQKEQNMTML